MAQIWWKVGLPYPTYRPSQRFDLAISAFVLKRETAVFGRLPFRTARVWRLGCQPCAASVGYLCLEAGSIAQQLFARMAAKSASFWAAPSET